MQNNENNSTLTMSHEDWLDARRKGLGGSDAGAILGLNKWASPLDVYLDKTGKAQDQLDNPAMEWGRLLEPVVANKYAEITGNKVRRNNRILAHPEHDFILANLDREIVGQNGILEVKCTRYAGDDWGPLGSDIIPDSYLAQVMHYMSITGADFADVAVLISGNDFRIYHIKRDQELIDIMTKSLVKFWHEYVLAGIAPDPINSNDFKNLWPREEGGVATAPFAGAHIAELKDLKVRIKELQVEATEVEHAIKNEMKDCAILDDGHGRTLATWKGRVSRRLDTKRFKEDHADLYDKYCVETETRTFIVK